MDISALLQTCGYPLLALDCLLEGETILALAGLAAHEGHLSFVVVVLIAAIWAPLVAGAGWAFGRAVETRLGEIHRFERWAVALAALTASFGSSWLLWRLMGRRRPSR